MSRINIALTGGQPAPVYYGTLATNPDKVVFIYSKESKNRQGDKIEKEIARLNIPIEQVSLDATDANEIKSMAIALAGKYSNDDIFVNITGGTKPWAYFFSMIFKPMDNASIVYIDQNNVLWNYKTMESIKCNDINMIVNFRLYGNELNHYTNFYDYDEEDKKTDEEIETFWCSLGNKYYHKTFNKLLATRKSIKGQNDLLLTAQNGFFDLVDRGDKVLTDNDKRADDIKNNQSFVEWSKDSPNHREQVKIVLLNILKPNKTKVLEINSRHAVSLAFNSGWFEYKVASLLSNWDKIKEIFLNCRFPSQKLDIVKNEVDIIFSTSNKIYFVECKTQIYDYTDIDKFRSAVTTYGGSGSKALFVTYEEMDPVALNKCQEKSIITFSIKSYIDNATCINALLDILNGESNKSNV